MPTRLTLSSNDRLPNLAVLSTQPLSLVVTTQPDYGHWYKVKGYWLKTCVLTFSYFYSTIYSSSSSHSISGSSPSSIRIKEDADNVLSSRTKSVSGNNQKHRDHLAETTRPSPSDICIPYGGEGARSQTGALITLGNQPMGLFQLFFLFSLCLRVSGLLLLYAAYTDQCSLRKLPVPLSNVCGDVGNGAPLSNGLGTKNITLILPWLGKGFIYGSMPLS